MLPLEVYCYIFRNQTLNNPVLVYYRYIIVDILSNNQIKYQIIKSNIIYV